MRKWTKIAPHGSQIDVVLFERFSNHCLANALEPFRAANELIGRTAYRWRFLTLDGAAARSSSGLPVMPDGALADAAAWGDAGDAGDTLMLLAAHGYRELCRPPVLRALASAARRAERVVGLDMGGWLMAAAGLLDGRRATVHWDVLQSFEETFLGVEAVREPYVIDGSRITSGGAMDAFDLSLALIGAAHGEALRLDVAANFVRAPDGQDARSLAAPLKKRPLARALTLMQENLDHPLGIAELARAIGLTQKDLERRFVREYGAPPRAVYRRIRLLAARRLVENTDLSIAEIGQRCGYESHSALTRAFRETFGVSPSGLRNR